jgi:hypothetical protein
MRFTPSSRASTSQHELTTFDERRDLPTIAGGPAAGTAHLAVDGALEVGGILTTKAYPYFLQKEVTRSPAVNHAVVQRSRIVNDA